MNAGFSARRATTTAPHCTHIKAKTPRKVNILGMCVGVSLSAKAKLYTTSFGRMISL
jgi:hypothetical protein